MLTIVEAAPPVQQKEPLKLSKETLQECMERFVECGWSVTLSGGFGEWRCTISLPLCSIPKNCQKHQELFYGQSWKQKTALTAFSDALKQINKNKERRSEVLAASKSPQVPAPSLQLI